MGGGDEVDEGSSGAGIVGATSGTVVDSSTEIARAEVTSILLRFPTNPIMLRSKTSSFQFSWSGLGRYKKSTGRLGTAIVKRF